MVVANDQWSSTIPSDLLVLVLERLLSLPDRIRFAAVCRLWRSITLQNYHLPSATDTPLLLTKINDSDYDDDGDDDYEKYTIGLFDVTSNRIYKLPPTKPIYKVISATSFGWLFIRADHIDQIGLLNPVTGAMIPLPPLHHRAMGKAVLSADPNTMPSSKCVIMCLCDSLGFCRIGDRTWSFFPDNLITWNCFHDVIHHKGQFYAVTNKGRVGVFNPDNPALIEVEVEQQISIAPAPAFNIYLVESCDGELLVVTRYKYGVVDFQNSRTFKFSIHRLADNAAVTNLGDQTVLLGRRCTATSVSGSDMRGGLRPNCIYFVEEIFHFTPRPYGRVSVSKDWEVGVYDLKCLTVQHLDWSMPSRVMWITPTSSVSEGSERL